jgi:hypothetical protein
LILGLLANALLTARVMTELKALAMTRGVSASLPCPAIPTRFVLEEPACAQKLLESMNVTNVHIREVQAPIAGDKMNRSVLDSIATYAANGKARSRLGGDKCACWE